MVKSEIGKDMDVSKLKFNIEIAYDCDEGKGCEAILVNGNYEQAKRLLEDLGEIEYTIGYDHYMSLGRFDVYDENDELLDFSTILGGVYEWIGASHDTSDNDKASNIPLLPDRLLIFLEKLKNGDEEKKAREIEELKTRIDKLKKELKEAEERLDKLENK